jgi:hypothetical protein
MSTVAAAAKHLFMNERSLKVLIDAGTITRQSRDNYSLDVVRKEYIEHLRAVARADNSAGLSEARTRLTEARASSAEFAHETEQGKWCLFTDAVQWMTHDIGIVKEHLLAMPGELSGILNQEQCEAVDDRVRQTLMNIRNPDTFCPMRNP